MKLFNKKANIGMAQLVMIIFTLSAFLILFVFQGTLFAQEDKETVSMACKSQLVAASQGKVVGFNDCANYMLIFKEKVAEKYILKTDKVEIFEKFDYSSILKKLHNKDLVSSDIKIEDNKIPEEVIFYILSEEIKFCYDVYSADLFATYTIFEKVNSHMCHSCDLIIFDDKFKFADNGLFSMKKLNNYFNIMPADKKELTYADYVKSSFKSDLKTQYQEDSRLLKNNIYNLVMTYDPVPKEQISKHLRQITGDFVMIPLIPNPGGISIEKKKETRYVKSSHVLLINQDFFAEVCSCQLNLAPLSIDSSLKPYTNLLNEEILFMV